MVSAQPVPRSKTRYRRRVACISVFACLHLLTASASPAFAQAPSYRVTNGDVLRITVYGDPGLSGSFPIGTDGTVGYPLLGNVAVTGKSVSEIREAIGTRLKEHIANLSVAVVVEAYAPVFVVGEVQKPGRYEFRPGMIALELFALGGGQKEALARGESAGIQLAGLRQDYADLGVPFLAQDV